MSAPAPRQPMSATAGGVVMIEDFAHSRGHNCGSAALRSLLRFHDLQFGDEPLTESMIFGLSGGLSFVYLEIPLLYPPAPPLIMNGRASDLERDACANLDIELDLRRTHDCDAAWRWLEEELAAGRPTMVWADLKLLDYHDVQVHQTFHNVVVVGYDLDAGRAWVADHTFDGLQQCGLQSLASARNSTAIPGPNEHGTFVMRFPAVLPTLEEAVRRGVAKTVLNMRNGSREPAPALSGLAALDAFLASFPSWPERFDEGFPMALKGLRFFVSRAGNEGAFFRRMQAEFLSVSAQRLESPHLARMAGIYDELSTAWSELARGLRGPDPLRRHEAALGRIERIGELEHAGIAGLERWLQAQPACR